MISSIPIADAGDMASLQYEISTMSESVRQSCSPSKHDRDGKEPGLRDANRGASAAGKRRSDRDDWQYLRNGIETKTPEVHSSVSGRAQKMYDVRAKLRAPPRKVNVRQGGDYAASR